MPLTETADLMETQRAIPDFETLVALHRCDPIAFEAVRHSLLQTCLDEAPAAHRPGLEKLVARMDRARAAAATPAEAAIAAARLMIDSLEALHGQFAELAEATAAWQTTLLLKKLRNTK